MEGQGDNHVGRKAIDDDDVENDNTAASKETGLDTADTRYSIAEHKCLICGADVEDGHVICEDCADKYLAD